MGLMGVFSVLFGLFAVNYPRFDTMAFTIHQWDNVMSLFFLVTGSYAIVFGTLLLVLAFKLRARRDHNYDVGSKRDAAPSQ